jgi:hypothetical protein
MWTFDLRSFKHDRREGGHARPIVFVHESEHQRGTGSRAWAIAYDDFEQTPKNCRAESRAPVPKDTFAEAPIPGEQVDVWASPDALEERVRPATTPRIAIQANAGECEQRICALFHEKEHGLWPGFAVQQVPDFLLDALLRRTVIHLEAFEQGVAGTFRGELLDYIDRPVEGRP